MNGRIGVAALLSVLMLRCGGAAAADLPSQENDLIAQVNGTAAEYRAAPNDMARGALRGVRMRALCSDAVGLRAKQGAVKNWSGTIERLDATNDGQGVLSVRIADNVVLRTTNNTYTESGAVVKTLIAPRSALFAKVSAMRVGQAVTFDGRFAPSKLDCLQEMSLTVGGDMTRPAFLFHFDDVRPTP